MDEKGRYQMEELVSIVAKLTKQYAGYESTSVTYEKAQQLMEAVLYCISELVIDEKTTLLSSNLTAEEAYGAGYEKVLEKVEQMRLLYNALTKIFDSYGNKCLYDAVVKEVPEFLMWYDVKYNPQNTIVILDYPLLVDISKYSGIDAVFEYVKHIYLEQLFLHSYPKVYVEHILQNECKDVKGMIENLFHIVLSDIMKDKESKKRIQEMEEEYLTQAWKNVNLKES